MRATMGHGPCAIEGARYNNDTQFDTWKIFPSTLITNAIDSANNRSMLSMPACSARADR
jgi:hypothetical protein